MALKIINDALSIKVMKVTYPIYRGKDGIVNKLADAAADGTLDALVRESADENTNGDTTVVIKALKKCLASYKVNIKKASGHIDMAIEQIRIETLENWLNSHVTSASAKNERYGRVENGRPKWDVSAADITALVEAADNNMAALEECYKAVNSIYNCIASKLSKDLADAELLLSMAKRDVHPNAAKIAACEERVAVKDRIMAASAECTVQKATLRKRIDALKAAAVDITDKATGSLLEKVSAANGRTVFSKDEAAKLQEMLKAAGFIK